MDYRDSYNQYLEHTVTLPGRGILNTTLEWNSNNIECDWTWGHHDNRAYVSFSDPGQAMLWKLRWWDTYVEQAKDEPDEFIDSWEC